MEDNILLPLPEEVEVELDADTRKWLWDSQDEATSSINTNPTY